MGKWAKEFHEPWTPMKARQDQEMPDVSKLPEDAQASLRESWQRSQDNSPWYVMGKRMSQPGWVQSLMGAWSWHTDLGILTFFRSHLVPKNSPSQQEFAERVCDCVNALAGVDDPAAAIRDIDRVMLKLQQCQTPEDLEALKCEALVAWSKIMGKEREPEAFC